MAGSTPARIGLSCALSTPFTLDGAIDAGRLAAQARWVLANGCDGVTAFGTTGEGASIGLSERAPVLEALAAAGLDPRRQIIAGIAAATVEESVMQARIAYAAGCRGVMVAPPFYFGQASDEGLFRFFAAMFDRLGGDLRDVILYHIPGMTRNGISVDLTQRLAAAYPGAIIAVKDSNGDWAATERRLAELPGIQILVGDERHLARAVRMGGGGSICGLANIAPDLLRPLAHEGQDDARVGAMVEEIIKRPVMAAVKALIADRLGDDGWRAMRPPLEALPEAEGPVLAATIARIRAGTREAA